MSSLTTQQKRIWHVLAAGLRLAEKFGHYSVSNHVADMTAHSAGYAEPGYTDPACGIIVTGNWNDVDVYDENRKERVKISDLPSRMANLLEKLGAEIEWSDEWSSCDKCGKLVRTSPDGHSWTPSYRMTESGIYCTECHDENENDGTAAYDDTSCPGGPTEEP